MANNKDFKVKNGIKPAAYHEAVGTVTSTTRGYELINLTSDGISHSFASEDNQVNGIFFKPDGTKMYIAGNQGDTVEEYTLSTAWDLTSTITNTHSENISGKETSIAGLFFSSDGLRMYIVGTSSDSVHQYDLGTAWTLSTVSFVRTESVVGQDTAPTDVFFKPDGTKMFVLGGTGDDVNEYTLSSAWDISNITLANTESLVTQDNSPQGITFKPDGTKMFMIGAISDSIHEYTLSTAWDTSTLSFVRSADISSQDTSPLGITFKDDGTKLYMVGNSSDSVHQYSSIQTVKSLDISTGSVFEITPTSGLEINLSNPAASGSLSTSTLLLNGAAVSSGLSGATVEKGPTSHGMDTTVPVGFAVLDSGTKFFAATSGNGKAYRYDLTTAYDSTETSGTPDQTVNSPSELAYNTLRGWYISPDGYHAYYLEGTGTASTSGINEYSLSTAYDLSTLSFERLGMINYTTAPNGLYFSYDGTKAYMSDEILYSGNTINYVYQFSLNTAWNISSFSGSSIKVYQQSNTTDYPVLGPKGMAFSNDGVYFYVASQSLGKVYEWECTTPWDLTTASYTGSNISTSDLTSAAESTASAMYVPSGTSHLFVGGSNDTITRANIGIDASISYDSTVEFAGGTAPTSPENGQTDVLTFSTRDGGTSYQAALAIDGAS